MSSEPVPFFNRLLAATANNNRTGVIARHRFATPTLDIIDRTDRLLHSVASRLPHGHFAGAKATEYDDPTMRPAELRKLLKAEPFEPIHATISQNRLDPSTSSIFG